jgi:hypothetical protein
MENYLHVFGFRCTGRRAVEDYQVKRNTRDVNSEKRSPWFSNEVS